MSDEALRVWLARLEREAIDHPARHTVRLVVLAAVGYLYPAIVLTACGASIAGLLWILPVVLQWDPAAAVGWLVVAAAALALAGSAVRACQATLGEPSGQVLPAGEGAALRALVDDVQRAIRGVPVDEIRVGHDFNAAVAQHPTRGLFGGHRNILFVGLPLLGALAPDELRQVLAHEFGHLARDHGLVNRWIYGLQQSWQNLSRTSSGKRSLSWWVLGWFLARYPRHLEAVTLARRRLHELEADRLAAALGPEICGSTLVKVEYLGHLLSRDFWPEQLGAAGRDPIPPADILARQIAFLERPQRPERFAAWCRRQACRRTELRGSHPCLRERLRAVGQVHLLESPAPEHPTLPAAPAPRAMDLLGPSAPRLLDHHSRVWKAEIAPAWRQRHQYLEAVRKHALAPAGTAQDEEAGEREWRILEAELPCLPGDEPLERLRAFLAVRPGHPAASLQLGQLLLGRDDESGLALVEAAIDSAADLVAPGLNALLEYHRGLGDDARADAVAARLDAHLREAARGQHQRTRVDRRDVLEPHDLTAHGLQRVLRVLRRYPRIRRAFVVRRAPRARREKADYVIAVDTDDSWLEGTGPGRALLDSVQAGLPIPCTVVSLGFGSWSLRERLSRVTSAIELDVL